MNKGTGTMDYRKDRRIVMTLDAGGTRMVFSALQSGEEVVSPRTIPTGRGPLEEILLAVIGGFEDIRSRLPASPSAVCFGFPAPADYRSGVIGDLENIPSFRGGVALGPMLEDHFGLPVFIYNDGDLFAYGESLAGFLPHINAMLEEHGSARRYSNLLGVTLGTGIGGGIVTGGRMLQGDNTAQGEINRMRNRLYPQSSVEDSAGARGVRRVFAREAGIAENDAPSPKEIYKIGMGLRKGNSAAARCAFAELATATGDAIANAVTLLDGLVVLGGGLAGAHRLFLARLVNEMNTAFTTLSGKPLPRLETTAFNLEDPAGLQEFLYDELRDVTVPFSNRTVTFEERKRVGVGVSRLGTEQAVALGAYAAALERLDGK